MTTSAVDEGQCWLCGRNVFDSEYEWRVKVWNNDSISATGIDVRICTPCSNVLMELLEDKRRDHLELRADLPRVRLGGEVFL